MQLVGHLRDYFQLLLMENDNMRRLTICAQNRYLPGSAPGGRFLWSRFMTKLPSAIPTARVLASGDIPRLKTGPSKVAVCLSLKLSSSKICKQATSTVPNCQHDSRHVLIAAIIILELAF